jgi:regulator of sigma E protease
MTDLLFTIAAFILALGVLIVVHELGHYWVARWCGVKVLRFSVGFGRPLLLRRGKHDGTEWVVAAIPFGGYVKMLDERELEEGETLAVADAPRAFNRQSVGKRIAIVVAGPLANFLLAIGLYWGLNLYGVQEPVARVAAPAAQSVAAQSGLAAGDRIVAAEGEAVHSWIDLRWRVVKAATDRRNLPLEVESAAGTRRNLVLDLSAGQGGEVDADFTRRLGLELMAVPPAVGRVLPGSAAEAAGLLPGDRIVAADDKPVASVRELIARVRASGGRPLALQVQRGQDSMRVAVTPHGERGKDGTEWRIGAELANPVEMTRVRHAPLAALTNAVKHTADMSWFSLRMLGKMLLGEVSFKNLSGPVTIADYAGQSARMGLAYYIGFIALISVSLGVLNLLPIPVLDGGHLLYYLAELFRGSPLPEKWFELGQRAGLGLLFVLMAIALFNDFARLLS